MSTDKTNSGKTLFQKIYIVIAIVLAVANVLAGLCHHLVAPHYCEIDVVYEILIFNVIFLAIAFLIYSLKITKRFRNTVYVLSILLLAPFLFALFMNISIIPNDRKNQAHWDYWQEVEKNTAAALEEENVEQETTYTQTHTKPSSGRTATTPPRQTSGEDNTDYMEILEKGDSALDNSDYTTAYECFSYLAEKGVPEAQYSLAFFYETGICVDIDNKKAFELYEKAANQGLADAYRGLAHMYYEGVGVEQDYDKAFKLAVEAVKKDDIGAIHLIALMYYHGHGVEKNLDKALRLAELAAEGGWFAAEFLVKRIKKELSESNTSDANTE